MGNSTEHDDFLGLDDVGQSLSLTFLIGVGHMFDLDVRGVIAADEICGSSRS